MRIDTKKKEIENYLYELGKFMPQSLKEYLGDFKTKAACERYFEKIIEAVVDLAFLVIKENGFKTPEDDKEAFDILSGGNIISKELSEKLKDAKGMRNIIAHQYGSVDDEIIFDSITKELAIDVRAFIDRVTNTLKKPRKSKVDEKIHIR